MTYRGEHPDASTRLQELCDFDLITSVDSRRELLDSMDGVGGAVEDVLRLHDVPEGNYATWEHGSAKANLLLVARKHDMNSVQLRLVRNKIEPVSEVHLPLQAPLQLISSGIATSELRMKYFSLIELNAGDYERARPFYDPSEDGFSLDGDRDVGGYFATLRTLLGALIEVEEQPTRFHS